MIIDMPMEEGRPLAEADRMNQALDWLQARSAATALDVSAGFGQAAAALAGRGPQVLALTSAAHLDRCRRDHPTLSFTAGNPAHFALRQGRDRVFSWMACADLRPEEGPAALRCLARACAPGGRLVVECAGPGHQAALEEAFCQVMAEHGLPLPRERWRPSLAQAAAVLEQEGLTVIAAVRYACPTLIPGRDLMMARLALQEEEALAAVGDRLTREAILDQTLERAHSALYHPQGFALDDVHLRLCALCK
jgi:SAM-dependent methyltransferase